MIGMHSMQKFVNSQKQTLGVLGIKSFLVPFASLELKIYIYLKHNSAPEIKNTRILLIKDG